YATSPPHDGPARPHRPSSAPEAARSPEVAPCSVCSGALLHVRKTALAANGLHQPQGFLLCCFCRNQPSTCLVDYSTQTKEVQVKKCFLPEQPPRPALHREAQGHRHKLSADGSAPAVPSVLQPGYPLPVPPGWPCA